MRALFFKDYFENDWSVSYFCLHTKYVLQDCILRLISFSESTKISVWQFRENNEKRKAKRFKNPFAKKRTFAEFPIMKHDYAVSRIWLFVIESNEVKQNCNDFPHQINQKIVWLKETIGLSNYSNWLNYIFFLIMQRYVHFVSTFHYVISFDVFYVNTTTCYV